MDALAVALVTIAGGLLVARAFRARWQARSPASLGVSEWSFQLKTIPRSLKLFEFRGVRQAHARHEKPSLARRG